MLERLSGAKLILRQIYSKPQNLQDMQRSLFCLCVALSAFSAQLHAQIKIGGLSALTYTENFDLPGNWANTTTRNGTWTQNTGYSYTDTSNTAQYKDFTGWYLSFVTDPTVPTYASLDSSRTVIGGGTAGGSSGALNSIFAHSSTASGDMALTLRTVDGTQAAMGLVFHNDSGSDISDVSVSYTGEQWRRQSTTATQLDFQYIILDSFDAQGFDLWGTTGWTDVNSLDFVSPVTGSASNLDGNASANSSDLADSFNIDLEDGQYLAIRWLYSSADEENVAGHALGIDDLSISFTTVTVPEPATFALAAGLPVLALAAWRRRRKSA
jgi:hypothetical protein